MEYKYKQVWFDKGSDAVSAHESGVKLFMDNEGRDLASAVRVFEWWSHEMPLYTREEVKPEPKDGEWWLCEIVGFDYRGEEVVRRVNGDWEWWVSGNVTPIHKMVKADD